MGLDRRARRALSLMGIERWTLRGGEGEALTDDAPARETAVAPAPTPAPAPASSPSPSLVATSPAPATLPLADTINVDAMDVDALRATVAGCQRCALHSTRTHTVFGVGSLQADWMFVGEAPGAQEDRQGEPFVGRAGQLLNAMLAATGRERQEVFIANVLKCRPPNNRDPSADEAAQCAPYLQRQIALIRPKVIIALGRIAAQRLLGVDTPLGRLRGRAHQWQTDSGPVPLVVTYHPAYLLRSPGEKRKAWEDLRLIMELSA
ncbi:MAG: uracil-DNA glycosylase [Pseudomonadota bacterium]